MCRKRITGFYHFIDNVVKRIDVFRWNTQQSYICNDMNDDDPNTPQTRRRHTSMPAFEYYLV